MAKKPASASTEAHQLAEAKLASSGLTWAQGIALGLEVLEPEATAALSKSFKALPALKLPYFDPRTGQPLRPQPGWPPFYRLRYLKTATDFAAVAAAKPLRYTQPLESGVCAYFPRLPDLDWKVILADPDIPLILTEGEFKAAKTCAEGFPTIGLGGVYNYRSAKLAVPFLPELEAVRWVKRHVYLIFDSDFRSNQLVCKALNDVAEVLFLRGAIVHLVALPDVVEGGKTGLDDFLVACPAAELGDLLHDRAQPLTLARAMWKLNERVCYVYDPGLVVVEATGQKMTPSQFKEHAFAALDYAEQVVNKDGSVSMKPASAPAAWLKWPLRREVGKLTYAPGKDRFVLNGEVIHNALNTWPGWGCEPRRGDPKPFLQLVQHLFRGATLEAQQWFLRWCAYPLQYPGVKMFTSAVVYGLAHGTGKSLIGYTLGRIYGKNFVEIRQADLHNNFNEWAENKQFVLGDDVTGSDKRQDADMLKKLITQRELRVNPKYIPSYVVPDCLNYLFTSNQPDAFFLEDTDRRFFIHEVTIDPLPEDFYMDYQLWLETGGAEAVFHHLQHLDLGDFNPAAPALRTAAKERMTEDTRSDLGSWVRRLKAAPDAVLRLGQAELPGDLFTNAQLLALYDPTGKTRTTANGLGRELRRAGFRQVLDGVPVRHPDGGQDRYYVVRHHARWENPALLQVQQHLAKHRSGLK